jgi:hypothetical protein
MPCSSVYNRKKVIVTDLCNDTSKKYYNAEHILLIAQKKWKEKVINC